MKHIKIMCPICGQGNLNFIDDFQLQKYKNKHKLIAFQYCECEICGAETASAEQLKFNKRQMIAFQKNVDGLLSGAEIRQIRENIGLTIRQAGQIIGGGPVSFSKYENDDQIHSLPMDSALRMIRENPTLIYSLAHTRGVNLSNELVIKKAKTIFSTLDSISTFKNIEIEENHPHSIKIFIPSLSHSVYEVYADVNQQKCQA